jgi:hypothetical protein
MNRLVPGILVVLLALSPSLAFSQSKGAVEFEPSQVDKEYAEYVVERLKPSRWGRLKAIRGESCALQTSKGLFDQPAYRGVQFVMSIGYTTVSFQRLRTKNTHDGALLFDSMFADVARGIQGSTIVLERRGVGVLAIIVSTRLGADPIGAETLGRYLDLGWKGRPAPRDFTMVVCRYKAAVNDLAPRESFAHFTKSMRGRMGKAALMRLWDARARAKRGGGQPMSNPNEVLFESGAGPEFAAARVRLLPDGLLAGGGETRAKADDAWGSLAELLQGRNVVTRLEKRELRLPSLSRE